MSSLLFRRKAVYDCKLRAGAAEPGCEKQRKILTAATNYFYWSVINIPSCVCIIIPADVV